MTDYTKQRPVTRNLRARWHAEVMKSTRITDSVRVLLMVMETEMMADGYVSVPRSKLAEMIGRDVSRVTQRIKLAKDAGFLDVVVSGQPKTTAVYKATLPDRGVRTGAPQDARTRGADSRVQGVHPGAPWPERGRGAPGQAASSNGAPARRLCVVRGANRDELRADLARLRGAG